MVHGGARSQDIPVEGVEEGVKKEEEGALSHDSHSSDGRTEGHVPSEREQGNGRVARMDGAGSDCQSRYTGLESMHTSCPHTRGWEVSPLLLLLLLLFLLCLFSFSTSDLCGALGRRRHCRLC